MANKAESILGVAVNDADFRVYHNNENGKNTAIESYVCWKNMIKRCYDPKIMHKNPTYKDCFVCDEWLRFTGFHNWFVRQVRNPGWQLDKDFLKAGNKCYCPELCIYIPRALNAFANSRSNANGQYPIGVSKHKKTGKYQANCRNPFNKNVKEYLGIFSTPDQAHKAWKARKHELACMWAEKVSDPRLKQALRTRYI